MLDLMISHGESGTQAISLYRARSTANNNYIRIRPLTRYGAPARGASVVLLAGGRRRLKSIDAASGFGCQMEPVAHFGLGRVTSVSLVQVIWPDGTRRTINAPSVNSEHPVSLPVIPAIAILPAIPPTRPPTAASCAMLLGADEPETMLRLIASTPVVIVALEWPMPCTLSATNALDTRSACYRYCLVMAYTLMAYVVMSHIVMAYIVMAYIVMTCI